MDLHPDKNGNSNSQSDGLNNTNGGNGVVEDGERIHSGKVPELTKLNGLETASSQSLFRTLHKILHDSIENKKEDRVSSVFKKLIQMTELNNQMISRSQQSFKSVDRSCCVELYLWARERNEPAKEELFAKRSNSNEVKYASMANNMLPETMDEMVKLLKEGRLNMMFDNDGEIEGETLGLALKLLVVRFFSKRNHSSNKPVASASRGSWFKREQIMKTRTREQTWSLDQFKNISKGIIETTGPPPAPTGPPPAPTTGPPSDHRRCTTCTHRHIGPLSDHRRTTAGPPPPPDHRRTNIGPPPDHRRTTAGAPLAPIGTSDHCRTTIGPPPDHRRCTTCTHRHIGPLPNHR
ncbi:hypothetical protein LXL04_019310 [Taraxacum kok-saghyz]